MISPPSSPKYILLHFKKLKNKTKKSKVLHILYHYKKICQPQMKVPQKTNFQVHFKLYKKTINCLIGFIHLVNQVKFYCFYSIIIWFIKQKNIYNIGEVENKSWSNTVIDTNRFYDSIYVTRIYHLKWPLRVSIYFISFKHLEIIQVF